MKKEWKQYIEVLSRSKPWHELSSDRGEVRDGHYSWQTVVDAELPFSTQLKHYIKNFIGDTEYINDGYLLIKYEEGDYIGEHTDSYGKSIVTYVCEIKPSLCGSQLLIENKPYGEVYYHNDTKHEVKKIERGTRISLTMFGRPLRKTLI